jgi:hypothetical protein
VTIPRRTYDLESRFALPDSSGQWRRDERIYGTRKEAEMLLQEYQSMNPSMRFRLVVVRRVSSPQDAAS